MTSDGAIKCWGDGIYGQTLVPTMPNPDANPDAVWAHVFAGDRHACGLTTDLAAACWGDSSNGKLAVPTTDDMGNDILGWIKLAAGLQHTCECLGATAMILQLVPWLGGSGASAAPGAAAVAAPTKPCADTASAMWVQAAWTC